MIVAMLRGLLVGVLTHVLNRLQDKPWRFLATRTRDKDSQAVDRQIIGKSLHESVLTFCMLT